MVVKRFLAVLLMMVFVLSTCFSAFAATSYDGAALPKVWNSATGKNEDITAAVKENNGIGGKDANDTYYTVNVAGGKCNTGFAPVTTIIGNTMECQFMLSDALSTMVISPRFYTSYSADTGKSGYADNSDLYVDSTGIRYYRQLWSTDGNEITAKYDIVPGRWYTLVAEFDDYSASDGQQTGKFYINGDMVLESKNFKPYGFIRMGIGPVDANHPIMIDNIICSNSRGADASETHELDIERSKVSYITNIANGAVMSEDSKSVKVLSNMTVGDIKAGLTTTDGADDIVSIYNKDLTTLADDNDNAVGKVIVVASKNGTSAEQAYNYYPIVSDKYAVEINVLRDGAPAANFYDNNSVLSFGATFTNFDGREYNPTLYVALYKDGILEKLWTDTARLTQAGTTANLSVDVSDMPSERIGTSIKIMLVEGETLTPYSVAKKLRFGYADTPATLYIIGDSIAQTYEINSPGETTHSKSPFIQGWGYHIDSYLNDSITVDNRARSSWDTDRFLYPDGIYTKEDGVDSAGIKLNDKDGNPKVVSTSERYKCWPSIKEDIKVGDYLMIALGINDAGSANVPDDRFEENLTVLCREAQSKGATVIFSTPTINGGKWTDEWSFKEESSYRGSIMAKVASDNGAYCLPTGATLAALYNSIYNEYAAANPNATTLQKKQHVRSQFHRYDAVFNSPISEGGYGYTGISGLNDQQHYADRGAKRVAGIIATLISQTDCTLADYLINLPDEL